MAPERRRALQLRDLRTTPFRIERETFRCGEGIKGADEALSAILSAQIAEAARAALPEFARAVGEVVCKRWRRESGLRERDFYREVACFMRFAHPAIVRFVAFAESANGCEKFILMERMPQSLRTALDTMKAFTPTQVMKIAYGVAHALKHLHRQRMVYRDIKEANILLTEPELEPKMCDFGLAKAEIKGSANTVQPQMGYCHNVPELDADDPSWTSQADVWAFGSLLEALFKRCSVGVDPELARVLKECVAEDPSARPSMSVVVREMKTHWVTDTAPDEFEEYRRRIKDGRMRLMQLLLKGVTGTEPAFTHQSSMR
jgi:hypothetical protein